MQRLTVRVWGLPTPPMLMRLVLVVMVWVLGSITIRLEPLTTNSLPAQQGAVGRWGSESLTHDDDGAQHSVKIRLEA